MWHWKCQELGVIFSQTVNPALVFAKSMVIKLPARKRISLFWNIGFILGTILSFQIVTGLLLVINYGADRRVAFDTVQFIIYEINYGFVLRIFHFNGASLFFIFLYLHIIKGLFYFRYRLHFVWIRGVTILILTIMTAFLGYVLVWGQMRFWAAVVITNLIRVIPYLGSTLVVWIWAGFSVNNGTLGLFFMLHFLVPFIILILIMVHLVFLHSTGRTSTLMCHGDYDKIRFFPYHFVKEGFILLVWGLFFVFVFSFPFILGDAEMFIAANSLRRPVHIVPEWYFLFAYAILRSIPNKIMGVVAFAIRLATLYFFALPSNYVTPLNLINKFLVFWFIGVGVMLTWIGQCRVEAPFIVLGQIFSRLYFILLIILIRIYIFSNKIFEWAYSVIKAWWIFVPLEEQL